MKNKSNFGSNKPGKFGSPRPKFGANKPYGAKKSERSFDRKGPGGFKRDGEEPRYGKPAGNGPGFSQYKKRTPSDERGPTARPAFSARPGGYEKPYSPRKPGFSPRKPGFGSQPSGSGPRPTGYAPRPEFISREQRSHDSTRPSDDSSPRYKPFDRENKKPFGKPFSKFGSKPGGGFKKPYGGKPSFEKREDDRPQSDRPKFDRPKFDRPKFDRPKFDRPKFDKPGYGRDNYNRPKFDKPRYERPDSEQAKFEKPRYDRPNFDRRNFESQDENPGYVNSAPARDADHGYERPSAARPTRASEDLKGVKFLPGTTAKKLIVTLQDTKTVPTRLVWIYESMVGALPDGEPQPGDTVHVHDSQDRFLGSAIYNPHSKIRARIFAVSKQLFGDAYIQEALESAVSFRRKMGMLKGSCRVVFGEADGLPGLIADKIGDYLVIQPLTFAVDRRITRIVDILNELVCPLGIIIRNDVPIRAKEGLEVSEVVTHGEIPGIVKVQEGECVLFADPAGGQKTGLFLDQRLNREAIKPFSAGARVLDLFCHVGGWAMRAAHYGAASVIAVDSSKPSLEMAEKAAKENGLDQVQFVESDVFDYLRELETETEGLFDIIICDPPAFAKSKAHFEDAFRAYLSLNYLVMKKLKPGGILVTCSCSQAVSNSEFAEALITAARNARMQFQIIEKRGAPQDHPVLLGLPESNYLKCFIMRRTE